MQAKSLFIILISLFPIIGWSQIILISDTMVPHSKTQEMKWWEFSLTNNECERQTIDLDFSMDSSLVNSKMYWNDTLLKKHQIILPPNSQGFLKVFHEIFTQSDTLEINIGFHSEIHDTAFVVHTYYHESLAKKPHCFPKSSSGKFKIYTGDLKNPQVLVMDNQRNLILESSTDALFLDLSVFKKGYYIIQIGEEEFIVEKI